MSAFGDKAVVQLPLKTNIRQAANGQERTWQAYPDTWPQHRLVLPVALQVVAAPAAVEGARENWIS